MRRIIIGIVSIALPVVTLADWTLETESDPLTDETIATAMTVHVAGTNTHSIIVRCKENDFTVYVSLDEFIDDDLVDIRYRIDKGKLIEQTWSPSAAGTSVFAQDENELARQLVGGSTFIIEVRDFRGVAHRATFDLNGGASKILRVMEACDINLEPFHQQVEGLSPDIAMELEKWAPDQISEAKEIMGGLGKYDGPIDSKMDGQFALDLQGMRNQYVKDCLSGRDRSDECKALKIMRTMPGMTSYVPPVFVVLLDLEANDASNRSRN